VQHITEDWLRVYNEQRPHDALGGLPPRQFLPRQTTAADSSNRLSLTGSSARRAPRNTFSLLNVAIEQSIFCDGLRETLEERQPIRCSIRASVAMKDVRPSHERAVLAAFTIPTCVQFEHSRHKVVVAQVSLVL
jgi:hypothetical protein